MKARIWILISVVVAALLALGQTQRGAKYPSPVPREGDPLLRSVDGADLFRAYCASCHGADAKGHGPAARALKMPPSDLTRITARNRGVFPEARVASMIAGNGSVVAHGSREMPVWGPIFHQIEKDQDWGNVRIHNLVEYLKSIQAMAPKATKAKGRLR